MTIDKKRARRIASDEAHAWARSLHLDNPNAKSVLRALTLYVNGEGSCFVSIEQLAEDTDLSHDTVRRRLVWLDQIGAIVRLAQWLDANGRRNSEGRGKRTTDEIRLLLDADIEEIEARARGANEAVSPSTEQPQDFTAEEISPQVALSQPSQSCHHLISEPEPEDSPQPPLGGSVADASLEGWRDFESDWVEPILRQSIAQQVWAALKPEERTLARQAARGYVLWRKAQRKPPNVLGAHLFLKERDAWEKFAKLAPNGNIPASGSYPPDSPEAKAIRTIYAAGRGVVFEHKGKIVYRGEITPQMLKFATDAPDRRDWIFTDDRRAMGAWGEFFAKHITSTRGDILIERGGRRGIQVPWLYPPSSTGKVYTSTGPPLGELSDQDAADFTA